MPDFAVEALCGEMVEVDTHPRQPRAEAQVRQHEITCRSCMWIEEGPRSSSCQEDQHDSCPGTALITTLQLVDECACDCHEAGHRA